MISICSYCRKTIGEKEPYSDKRASHGICPVCYDFYMPQILDMDLSQHLDQYDSPIIMVDAEGRLVGVNQVMISFLGKPKEQILGLLGGELLECRYASLGEGCGHTVHCSTCSIRQTVNNARAAGHDLLDVPAYLDRESQRINFRISALNRGAFVKVVIDKIVGVEPLPA